jgi:hypothetical protein
MAGEQRFNEEEVKAILARAVDLERTGNAGPDVVGSLSLTELKEVASEAGIDEELVEEAATHLLARRPSNPSKWLGPAPSTAATRLLNVKLSLQDAGLLFRIVEEKSHRRGLVTEALGRVTWVSQQAQLTTAVSVSDQKGRARIDVEGSYPNQMRPLLQLIPGDIPRPFRWRPRWVSLILRSLPLHLGAEPLASRSVVGYGGWWRGAPRARRGNWRTILQRLRLSLETLSPNPIRRSSDSPLVIAACERLVPAHKSI